MSQLLKFMIIGMTVAVSQPEADGRNVGQVVASDAHTPLSNASIFNRKGKFIGISTRDGRITCASMTDYPITVRYMGFKETTIDRPGNDTIILKELITELPEVTVESRQNNMLHILGYMREYSTLSTYSDTISMFREKMVDFMLPSETKGRFKGWRRPRVINSRSYYHFTNLSGLDSVSDKCNQHFSWSDWIGLPQTANIPLKVTNSDYATDTLKGKYSPVEIWENRGGKVSAIVNVLADTIGRRWVPDLSNFFRNDDIDFEQLRLKFNYNNPPEGIAAPLDLTGYSFTIDSRGRGRNIFQFNRRNEPYFVTTYTEVYILDMEFITTKEAKKWDRIIFNNIMPIYEPQEAPELQPYILTLIDRVNNIDKENIRSALVPDKRLAGRNVTKPNFSIGYRALSLLKDLTGISSFKANKKFKSNWNDFRREQMKRNNRSMNR